MLGLLICAPAQVVAQTAMQSVQTHLGLYVTTPDRREAGEQVNQEGDRREAWFLYPMPRARRADATCAGLRWLLTGRLAKSQGARALFAALPEVETVALVFYDVETSVRPDAKGRYRQTRKRVEHARFEITRQKAEILRPAVLKETLRGARCQMVGKSLVDLLRLAPIRRGPE